MKPRRLLPILGLAALLSGCEEDEVPCAPVPPVLTADGIRIQDACGRTTATLLPRTRIAGAWRGGGDDGACALAGDAIVCPAGADATVSARITPEGHLVATVSVTADATVEGVALEGEAAVPGATSWQHYVERCAAIKGALAVCVFDLHSKLPLAACGGPPAAARLAEQGATMLAAAADALRALGLGSSREELAVSTVDHHLLLRPVPGHPGVALQLVLAAGPANPMLARMQLERIEPPH